VFFFFAILTNIIVCAMLLLGGASVIQALTGEPASPRRGACPALPLHVLLPLRAPRPGR
jgi:hypothetical protein